MRRVVAVLALGLVALAMPAASAEKGKNSLDPIQGRFHKQHVKKLGLECGSCHSAEQKDLLYARNSRPMPEGMPGAVDRHTCLGCHEKPAKPGWYGGAKK